jgi:hypothetical protein
LTALVASTLPCACLATIDDSKVDGHDAVALDASDAQAPSDTNVVADSTVHDAPLAPDSSCWDGASPAELMLQGYAISSSEISLTFTAGPPYLLSRIPSNGENVAAQVWQLKACTTTFDDDGTPPSQATMDAGGLNPNWDYTYTLIALLADGGEDLRFGSLVLDVQTRNLDGGPTARSDGSTVAESPNDY